MMGNKLHILQHSLGVGDYGDKPSHRSHFVAGPGSDDYDNCMALVVDGFMTRRAGTAISGGDDIFSVTAAGRDHVALNSLARPPEPKLTRSQKNYQAYRHSECCESFAEWMGFKKQTHWSYAA